MATRFQNGSYGVSDANGRRFASKKALRELVRVNPGSVLIENLSFMARGSDAYFTADSLEAGTGIRTIAGPDPHTNRKWYASIERTKAGVLKVS